MKKIDKVLKRLSELYEFNRKIKDFVPKKKVQDGGKIQPARPTRH
ncbi:MAG TPA: hypothetical protein PK022_00830 [Syntrophales bacterium]|nr:hypothetical protein [Syntrophales bacterium]HQI25539.1 hypothetical protein [Smithella sp.]